MYKYVKATEDNSENTVDAAQLKRLNDTYNKVYDCLYELDGIINHLMVYNNYVEMFGNFMEDDNVVNVLRQLIQEYRDGDPFTSDRECAAIVIAYYDVIVGEEMGGLFVL